MVVSIYFVCPLSEWYQSDWIQYKIWSKNINKYAHTRQIYVIVKNISMCLFQVSNDFRCLGLRRSHCGKHNLNTGPDFSCWGPAHLSVTQGQIPEAQSLGHIMRIWSEAGLRFVRTRLGCVTLRVRITWPQWTTLWRSWRSTRCGCEVASLIDCTSLSVIPGHFLVFSCPGDCKSRSWPFFRRLSPAETIKITTSSSKRVRSLIIPQGIFPALTGKRVWGSSHCKDWWRVRPLLEGWKGTSEWHLCRGHPRAQLRRGDFRGTRLGAAFWEAYHGGKPVSGAEGPAFAKVHFGVGMIGEQWGLSLIWELSWKKLQPISI